MGQKFVWETLSMSATFQVSPEPEALDEPHTFHKSSTY